MNLEQTRRARPFALGDLVVYAVIAVLIAVVCLAVFLPKSEAMNTVWVYYRNAEVYRYDCATQKGVIIPCEGVEVTVNGDTVTISTELGVNVLVFGKDEVRMEDADCRTKECVRAFSPVRKGGDVLVCMPHALRVVAVGDVGNEVVL